MYCLTRQRISITTALSIAKVFHQPTYWLKKLYGVVSYIILNINIYFQFLNNITCIFIHFFIHTYFQKNWNLLFKQTYQIGPIYHTICTLYHSCLKGQTIIYCIWLSHRPSFFLYRYQSSTSNSNEKVCVKQ